MSEQHQAFYERQKPTRTSFQRLVRRAAIAADRVEPAEAFSGLGKLRTDLVLSRIDFDRPLEISHGSFKTVGRIPNDGALVVRLRQRAADLHVTGVTAVCRLERADCIIQPSGLEVLEARRAQTGRGWNGTRYVNISARDCGWNRRSSSGDDLETASGAAQEEGEQQSRIRPLGHVGSDRYWWPVRRLGSDR